LRSHSSEKHRPTRALLLSGLSPLADAVTLALDHGDYTIRVAATAEEASAAVAEWNPHLVVLDLDADGNESLRRFAVDRMDAGLPVIALTRRGDLQSRLSAFGEGVDDVLTVPFCPEELLARVIAVMRRTYRDAVPFTPILRCGDLEIDIRNRRVRAGCTEVRLTSIELRLLHLLAANAGCVLTRDDILDHLWGADYAAGSNVVDRHIRNLRVKLEDRSRRPQWIVTVPGRGYSFRDEQTS
jgi:DNA-binding response OmpR family regulator